jgi:hypothetical protein
MLAEPELKSQASTGTNVMIKARRGGWVWFSLLAVLLMAVAEE